MSTSWPETPCLQLSTPRRVLFSQVSRNAAGEVSLVPPEGRVDCVSSVSVAEILATRSEYRVPCNRSVALRSVASASKADVPRSMLLGQLRKLRRAAAASKVERLAARFANPSASSVEAFRVDRTIVLSRSV